MNSSGCSVTLPPTSTAVMTGRQMSNSSGNRQTRMLAPNCWPMPTARSQHWGMSSVLSDSKLTAELAPTIDEDDAQ